MPLPRAAQLAAAAVASLNSEPPGTFALAFTATRQWLLVHKLEALGDALHVSVTPLTEETDQADRGAADQDAAIGIAIQKRCAPGDIDAMDELVLLAEQIKDHLTGLSLETDAGRFRWIDIEYMGGRPFRAEMAYSDRTFTSQIKVTYQIDSPLNN